MSDFERTNIVISNFWHKPAIEVTVIANERDCPKGAIFLSMPFKDFLLALFSEVKHPVTLFTRSGLNNAIEVAAKAVIEKAKMASTEGVR